MDHRTQTPPAQVHFDIAGSPSSPKDETTLDVPKKKKGFLSGLLRRASLAGGKRPLLKKNQRDNRRVVSDGDVLRPRDTRRVVSEGDAARREKRRSIPNEESFKPRRSKRPSELADAYHETDWETEPEPSRSRKSRGKRPADTNGHRTPSPAPLTRWPPSDVGAHEDLSPTQAAAWVCRGTPMFKGHKRTIPHMPERYYALYTTVSGNRDAGSDRADANESMTQLMSLRMQSNAKPEHPWETLEQPSYAFYYGDLPGTITLNQWAWTGSTMPPAIALRDSGVLPRAMNLERVFERLQELRHGLEDDDPDLLYKILYKRILRDPDRIMHPHKTLDKQITDLILVLSRPDWIDFTNPRNQVVTRFIFDHLQDAESKHPAHSAEFQEQYRKFFHQLLLSLELEMRIQSEQHGEWAKEKLLMQIPPRIQWGLALARRWRQNVRIDDIGGTPDEIRLRYKLKKRQVKMLKRFAVMMKWPNLAETVDNLKARDGEFSLDSISSDAFAFFSGLILPGPTFPFLMMNTLIDLDPDPATDDLALLSHMHPACGFQYRSSYTYWSASCIVGKVLAPTCHSLAGWVGPARPTTDLSRSQIARVRTRRPRQKLRVEDIESMGERSEPLGPKADRYPVSEYVLPKLDENDIVDTVRVEMLGLRAAAAAIPTGETLNTPRLFDATVQFAVDGQSWPLRLMYDVTFLTATPCSEGPHPLFFDYVYTPIRVDEIMSIRDWGGLYGDGASQQDEERVLVVKAFGVRDNEVLARAWCAHWGLGAVVMDARRTCVACAVREAYAATLTVVVVVDGMDGGEE